MNNNYYIYYHIRLDTNTVFYIGKGKGNRAYSKKGRNSYERVKKMIETRCNNADIK